MYPAAIIYLAIPNKNMQHRTTLAHLSTPSFIQRSPTPRPQRLLRIFFPPWSCQSFLNLETGSQVKLLVFLSNTVLTNSRRTRKLCTHTHGHLRIQFPIIFGQTAAFCNLRIFPIHFQPAPHFPNDTIISHSLVTFSRVLDYLG